MVVNDNMRHEGKLYEPVPQGWPTDSSTLKDASLPKWQKILLASTLFLIPAPFIVLAVYIVSLHQKPESQLGSRVLEAASIAATLWPIAFAAVLGTVLRSVALYSCERGTTLGTLEILLGSLTLTNTLKSFFWVKLFSVWTPVLIVAWTLSPLGGQSVLRAVALQAETSSFVFPTISYPSTNFSAGFDELPALYALPFGLRTIFGAAFSSSATRLMHANGSSPNFRDTLEQVGGPDEARRLCKQDVWGTCNFHTCICSKDMILTTPTTGSMFRMIRFHPMNPLSGYRFCKPWVNGTAWLQENISQLVLADSIASEGTIGLNYPNNSFFTAYRETRESIFGSPNAPPNFQLDLIKDIYLNETRNGPNSTALDMSRDRPLKQKLAFFAASVNDSSDRFSWGMTTCSPSTSYVDAEVRCSRSTDFGFLSCSVEKLRHTKGKPNRANTTVFSFAYNLPVLAWTARLLPDPEGAQNDVLNLFLRDPTLARPIGEFYKFTEFAPPPPLDKVPLSVFEARLGTILNTVVRSSFEQSIIVGADGISPSSKVMTDRFINTTIMPLTDWGNSTGTWSEFTGQVYKVDWLWMSLYGASAFAMIIFTIGHVALQCKIRSPDILGSVSMLTRDSPYFAVPAGGSALGGIERVRLLKNEHVKIGDVQPQLGIGRIAFSNQAGTSVLDSRRRYV
ncbi:hypothetical protein FCULG_00012351 [Fusarium culmorum]|uniref:Uncharacterized protein n=1 Tax=Fusarium culmorum TaxID=5516 RepID=A0A2T4GRE9_FUSCU|nr:hypothetical protein FCULG_00012351 [Fusarium culmorum]